MKMSIKLRLDWEWERKSLKKWKVWVCKLSCDISSFKKFEQLNWVLNSNEAISFLLFVIINSINRKIGSFEEGNEELKAASNILFHFLISEWLQPMGKPLIFLPVMCFPIILVPSLASHQTSIHQSFCCICYLLFTPSSSF